MTRLTSVRRSIGQLTGVLDRLDPGRLSTQQTIRLGRGVGAAFLLLAGTLGQQRRGGQGTQLSDSQYILADATYSTVSPAMAYKRLRLYTVH